MSTPSSPKAPQHVLVLGAGYAGVLAAIRVARKARGRANVTLVNASPEFVERIRLHERGAGGRPPRRRIADMLRGTGVALRVAFVEAIDAGARQVRLREDDRETVLAYDVLVYALGSTVDVARVPGVREHALSLASDAAAGALAERLAALPPGARVAVVGGGLTAIEAASEIAESHPRLAVSLVCRDRIGAGLSEAGRGYVRTALGELGVALREDAAVSRVEEGGVVLEGGASIPAEITVWAGGFVASPVAARSGLACSPEGQLLLDPWLRAISSPFIFGAGDGAALASGEAAHVRMGCVTAMPFGAHAADNVAALLDGRPLQPFGFGFFIQCISLGRRRGLVQRVDARDAPLPKVYTGRLGARLKEAVCRFTTIALAVERLLPGTYDWPLRGAPLVAAPPAKALAEATT